MKNVGLLIILLLGFLTVNSQITITNATFPKEGDKLKYATLSGQGVTIDMLSNAGPRAWDFSVLNRGVKFEESYRIAKDGKDAAVFPDADMYYLNGREERYIKSSTTKLEELGIGGVNPLFNVPLAIRYTSKPVIRQAPLSFVGATKSVSSWNIALSGSVFPDSLLASFPAGFKPDSVKIQFSSETNGLMDAYGTLKMQGHTFEVLREKARVETSTDVFIKVGFLGWINISAAAQFGISLPEFIQRFLGKRVSTEYRYYANDKKEILVNAIYDDKDAFQSVTFADLGQVSATENIINRTFVDIYPNPASDVLTIQTGEWEDGMYLITLSDINGKAVYAEPTILRSGENKRVDISKFTLGTYFLTIRDQFNQKAVTSKVIISR